MHVHFIDCRYESDPEFSVGFKRHVGSHPAMLVGQAGSPGFKNVIEGVSSKIRQHAVDGTDKSIVFVCVCRQGKHWAEATKNARAIQAKFPIGGARTFPIGGGKFSGSK